MRRTKELPRKIRNLLGYCLSGLVLAGIPMCKGAFNMKTKLLSLAVDTESAHDHASDRCVCGRRNF